MYLIHIGNCHSLKVKKFGVQLETLFLISEVGSVQKRKKKSLLNGNLQSRKITPPPILSLLLGYFAKLVLSWF